MKTGKNREMLKISHVRENEINHWKVISPKQKGEVCNDIFGIL